MAVVQPELQLGQPFGMLPGQTVPEPVRPVFLSGQIQGIPPVRQLVIAQRKPAGHHRLKTSGGERRIPGRRVQLIGRVDTHSVTGQDTVPQTDRKHILQQLIRLAPLLVIHVGAN